VPAQAGIPAEHRQEKDVLQRLDGDRYPAFVFLPDHLKASFRAWLRDEEAERTRAAIHNAQPRDDWLQPSRSAISLCAQPRASARGCAQREIQDPDF